MEYYVSVLILHNNWKFQRLDWMLLRVLGNISKELSIVQGVFCNYFRILYVNLIIILELNRLIGLLPIL